MKWKRPLAMAGVILIAAMYIVAIAAAFSKSPSATSWLMAAIFSTVIVPVILYAVQLVYRVLKPEEEENGKNN